jgi:hypothetical protein
VFLSGGRYAKEPLGFVDSGYQRSLPVRGCESIIFGTVTRPGYGSLMGTWVTIHDHNASAISSKQVAGEDACITGSLKESGMSEAVGTQLTRQSQELNIFHDVAKALTSSLDLDSILQPLWKKWRNISARIRGLC